LPEVLPSLQEKYLSYLPPDTVTFKYPWKFSKTKCPVTSKNTVAWTEKERQKASKAPVFDNLVEFGDYVGAIFFNKPA